MRKLLWFGVTGLAIAAGSYATLRSNDVEPVAAKAALAPTAAARSCCAADPGSADESACCRGGAVAHCRGLKAGTFSPETGEAVELPAPAPATGTVELASSSTAVPATIFIPDPADAAPPIREIDESSSVDRSASPRLMPYCDDEDDAGAAPAIMPYAEADVWPAPAASLIQVSGWFEESVPAETIPVWREDETLPFQNPAGPESTAPGGVKGHFQVIPTRREKDPFLPVLPDVPGHAVPSTGPDAAVPADGSKVSRSNALPDVLLNMPGILRHTALKAGPKRDAERPARQTVDTLDIRPSDLNPDGSLREPF